MALRRDSLTLTINVVSAEGLNDDNELPEMKLYAVVSVVGDAEIEQRSETYVDADGGGNQHWNFPMKFVVDRSAAKKALDSELAISLNCKNRDCEVGQVRVPMWQLFTRQASQNYSSNNNNNNNKTLWKTFFRSCNIWNCYNNNNHHNHNIIMQCVSFPVKKTSSGKMEGKLNFEYVFEGLTAVIPPRVPTLAPQRPPQYQRHYDVGSTSVNPHPSPPPPNAKYGNFQLPGNYQPPRSPAAAAEYSNNHQSPAFPGHPNFGQMYPHESGYGQQGGRKRRKTIMSDIAAKVGTLVMSGFIIKCLTDVFGCSSQPPPNGTDERVEDDDMY